MDTPPAFKLSKPGTKAESAKWQRGCTVLIFFFLKKFFLKESFPCDDSLKLHYASK